MFKQGVPWVSTQASYSFLNSQGGSFSAALITGCATILAALIGVVGVTLIFWHRRTVVKICRVIEAFHAQEGWLVAKSLEVKKEKQVKH